MKRKAKSAIIATITIVALIVDIIYDFLLWVNDYVDGKYIFDDNDTCYMRVGSLSAAMFINIGVIILFVNSIGNTKKMNVKITIPI